ncbi:MAG: hypothetical protein LBE28_03590 [Providencia alcalifaciens]|jgi:hypothetical protein|nr:hypothetical protein [Providencia alcalifaciens]
MEFKGTPVPWIIIDGNDYLNITAKSTESSPNYMPLLDSDSIRMIEMRANAHLIAAAPELLEALQLIVSYHDDGNEGLHREDLEMARKAIAKALGQQ